MMMQWAALAKIHIRAHLSHARLCRLPRDLLVIRHTSRCVRSGLLIFFIYRIHCASIWHGVAGIVLTKQVVNVFLLQDTVHCRRIRGGYSGM